MAQLVGAIETVHTPEPEAKVMPVSLGQVFELIRVGVQIPNGHFVKQGFPDRGSGTVNQSDFG